MNRDTEFSFDFKYENSDESALKKAEGCIPKGKCVVLCGGSGCGKSTLLRCLNRLIPEFYPGQLEGHCMVNGQNTEKLNIGETGKIAASVFQDPRSQFFTLNSTTEIAFGLENHGFKHKEIVNRTEEAFKIFHLEKLKDRNVFQLSSGERQLIAILSAWATDTDVILLDEPAANLDFNSIENLKAMLEELKKQNKTMIISEHRLYYLRDIADEYWIIENGRIIEKISAEKMKSLTQEEINGKGLRTTDLEKIKKGECERENPRTIHTLKGENISFSYDKKGRKILDNFKFTGETGEVIGITGENGAGKTTFGKLITGLYKKDNGSFTFDGKKLNSRELSDKGIFIMQEAEFQFFTNSVINELLYGREHSKENIEEAERLLEKTGLLKYRNRHPFSLSGGEMQRLVMLLAYISEKDVVVLDEPTAGLDYENLKITMDLISEMKKKKIVFIITHDRELIEGVCTRVIKINGNSQRENKENILKKRLLDPRTKIFMLIIAMIAGIFTEPPLIISVFTVLFIIALYEKRYVVAFGTSGLMLLIYAGLVLTDSVAASFTAFFLPRMIIIGMGAYLVIADDETSRTLAGLRKLHIPERAIMIISVIFRFFPVLTKDIGIMNQSVKTRGFFRTFSEKIKGAPEYFEILIVPMAFRVMRIAEALSASAETRGISLKEKRYSYIETEFKISDYLIMILAVTALITGIVISII